MFEIFPNPIHDKAIIRINTKTRDNYSLEIFDVNGNKINYINFLNNNELLILKESFPVKWNIFLCY